MGSETAAKSAAVSPIHWWDYPPGFGTGVQAQGAVVYSEPYYEARWQADRSCPVEKARPRRVDHSPAGFEKHSGNFLPVSRPRSGEAD